MQHSMVVKRLMLVLVDESKREQIDEIVDHTIYAVRLAEFTKLSVSACADVIRNHMKDTGKSRRLVFSNLRHKMEKGQNIHA
jgi:hypothetical protein